MGRLTRGQRQRTKGERRTRLQVEQLEERSLLDAGMAGAVYDLDHVIVGYQNGDKIDVQTVEVQEGSSAAETIAELQESSNVVYAEFDYQVQVAALPNDTQFTSMYGLNNTGQSAGTVDADIDAPEAWDLQRGSTKTVVGIIDTGIDYRHVDMYKNVWINQNEIPTAVKAVLIDTDADGLITFWDLNDARNQGAGKITDLNANGRIDGGDILKTTAQGGWANGVSEDPDGYIDDLVGWDFVNNDNDPLDDNGHGTHVAGTIGAMGNNGVGVTGINWQVRMMGLKFLSASGSGATSGAVAALNYATAHGAKITNNSWGGGGYSQAMFDAINTARLAGDIFVAAAGNGGSDGIGDNNDTVANYPSNYNLDNVVAVAATDRNDRLASFSNYGATQVDLAAPGVSILSLARNDGYATLSGTSMATPHVAGVLALVHSRNADLTYSQLIGKVVNNTDPLANLSGKVQSGGRLNAFKALNATTSSTASLGARITAATPNATGPAAVSSVRVTFDKAIDATTFTAADVTGIVAPTGATLTVSAVNAVAGSGNTQFDILFNTQSVAGSYRFDIGPDVRTTAGHAMDQDRDNILGEAGQDTFRATFAISGVTEFSAAPNATIPDRGRLISLLSVNQDLTISDLNVTVNVTHTYDSDLYITLKGPDGTTIVLVNRRGGSGDNFTNTKLDDEAAGAIRSAAAPFAGSYRPDAALSRFDGKNARGTWQLIIEDRARYDVGRLVSWKLSFEGTAGANRLRSIEDESPASPASPGRGETSLTVGLSAMCQALAWGDTLQATTPVTSRSSAMETWTNAVFQNGWTAPTAEREETHSSFLAHDEASSESTSRAEELMAFFSAEAEEAVL